MPGVPGPAGPGADTALDQITPLVLTWDEEPNIARCLERLAWARRIVVLDSGSTDGTVDIARGFSNAEIHSRRFDDHAAQWNHGLSLVATPWVLTLDADYVVPPEFGAEAARIVQDGHADAARACFRYCMSGRPLRASLYPPRTVLFRHKRFRYEMDGHTQRLLGAGTTAMLATPFHHDDRKDFGRWMASQRKYAALEAVKLRTGRAAGFRDRVRKAIVVAPPGVFFYTLFVKGTIFDGVRGLQYAWERAIAEAALSAALLRRRSGGAP